LSKKNSNKIREITFIILLILTGLSVAVNWISIIFEVPQIKNDKLAVISFTGLFMFFLIWEIVVRQREINRLRDREPNLQVNRAYIRQGPFTRFYNTRSPEEEYTGGTNYSYSVVYNQTFRQVFGSTGDLERQTDIFLFVEIEFINVKCEGQELNDAYNVSVILDLFDTDLKKIYSNIDARWDQSEEYTHHLSSPRPDNEYLEINIPSNTTRSICPIVKAIGDNACYVYNLDTYKKQKLERKEVMITQEQIILQVTLSGSVEKKIQFWFAIDNSGGDIRINQVNDRNKIKEYNSKI